MTEYCSLYLPKHIPALCWFNRAPALVTVWKVTLFQKERNLWDNIVTFLL